MDYVMLGVGLLLTIGTGLFVASEFALVNLDRADLEARREAGETRLSLTISALRITSTHLSSAQLGITLTTLLTGYTMEPAISNLLRPVFTAWGMPEALVSPVAVVVAISVATIFSMIIGELVPKNFALAVPRQTAKLVIPFQVAFTTVFRPAIRMLNGSANGVLRALGVEPKEELSGARTAEELSSLVRRSASAGVLEKDTASLLDRSLRFSRLTAADVMTPRPSIHAVAAGDSAEDVVQLARRTGHSRFPVYDDSMDDITGIVHLKAAIGVPRDRRADVPAAALSTEPLRVPKRCTSTPWSPSSAPAATRWPSSSTSTGERRASSRSRTSSRRSSARSWTNTTVAVRASSAAAIRSSSPVTSDPTRCATAPAS